VVKAEAALRLRNGLRKKTTITAYSPFFETPLSDERGEHGVMAKSLGGWE
jgi:hypothetical protein